MKTSQKTTKPKQQIETQGGGDGNIEHHKTKDKMAVVIPHIPIVTLNVNRLNSPINMHGMD